MRLRRLFAVGLHELWMPIYRPPDTPLPEHSQTFAAEVQVHQRDVGAQSVVILGDASVTHRVEAEDSLQNVEHMFHLGPYAGLPPVQLSRELHSKLLERTIIYLHIFLIIILLSITCQCKT